jgi:HNH endonuclease
LKVPHWLDRCIICLKTELEFKIGNVFSNEHVIPESLGGILRCDFLCKDCNSKFGGTFEAKAKCDPAVRRAIAALQTELPSLYASIEKGQSHLLATNIGQISGRYKDGEVVHHGTTLADGTLLVPDSMTEVHLTKMLKRKGSEDADVAAALTRYRSAQLEVEVPLSHGIAVIKRETTYVGPDFTDSKPLDPLVALKIAYEFSVLVMGAGILESQFDTIRRCLKENDNSSKAFKVEPLEADKFDTFHGIVFEGNMPHATIQVRLFGKLAYRVQLLGHGFNLKPISYTQDLKSGEDDIKWCSTSP